MMEFIKSLGIVEFVGFCANICGVGAGVAAVILWVYPGTAVEWIDAYKELANKNNELVAEVAASTDIIAQSLPKWPKIGALNFEYEYPRRAHFLLNVENLRNVEVEEFSARVRFGAEGAETSFTFEDRNIILPYEDITLIKDATRESWIEKSYLSGQLPELVLCIQGVISGEKKPFFEFRRYGLLDKGAIGGLLERSFSSDGPHEFCT